MTHIVATSDFHGYLPEMIPDCDLLLVVGDVCPVWNHNRDYQAEWLRGEFSNWLKNVPARAIVGVGGNHDFVLQDSEIGYELSWHYLQNESIGIARKDEKPLTIWGSPMSNKFGTWAFMANETDLSDIWKLIPRDIDILMTHGPAYGHGDLVDRFSMTKRGMWERENVGSSSLRWQLEQENWPNLKLHVFGHIHEGYGTYTYNDKLTGLNVAHVDDMYDPINPVMEVDL